MDHAIRNEVLARLEQQFGLKRVGGTNYMRKKNSISAGQNSSHLLQRFSGVSNAGCWWWCIAALCSAPPSFG